LGEDFPGPEVLHPILHDNRDLAMVWLKSILMILISLAVALVKVALIKFGSENTIRGSASCLLNTIKTFVKWTGQIWRRPLGPWNN
jgi:hypothetical protein